MRNVHEITAALISKQLNSLLRIVDLEKNGKKVKVDGFWIKYPQSKSQRLQNKCKDESYDGMEKEERVDYQDTDATCRFEPRIKFIQKQFQSILKIANFSHKGSPAIINGFRLKNLRHWVSTKIEDENHGDPYYDILQYLSWPCTTNCEFCLFKGDPPGYFSKSKYSWLTSLDEIRTRIKYWDPDNNRALFSKSDYNFFEILTHPSFFDVALEARKKTNRFFHIVTGGAQLTRGMINSLEKLKPVFLVLSLNSDEPQLRKKFMKDKNPNIAIKSLGYLEERKIPYVVSLTGYKGIPLESLKNTITHIDKHNPYFIRVVLDAHTKYNPVYLDTEKSISRWKQIVKLVKNIREELSSPIIVQPVMFEECFFDSTRNRTKVEGVIKNSPAEKAGIKTGDEIVRINDIQVLSRPFAKYLLKLSAEEDIKEIEVKVRRSRKLMTYLLKRNNQIDYPYIQYKSWSPLFFPYGIVLLDGLDPFRVLEIENMAKKFKAKKILFLTSLLIKPSLEDYIETLNLFKNGDVELYIEVPKNNHFLGGDIIVGDLLVVEDFVSSVKEWIKKHSRKPDLIIIPSTPFTKWKRDLRGKAYKNIERELNIPVVLIESSRIININ